MADFSPISDGPDIWNPNAVKAYSPRAAYLLGTLQLFMGILTIFLGIVVELPMLPILHSYAGVAVGALLIFSGFIGLWSGFTATFGFIISFLISSASSLFACLGLLFLCSLAFQSPSELAAHSLTTGMTGVSILDGVLCVLSTVICAKAVCECSARPRTHFV